MPTQKEIAEFYAANANNPAAIQAAMAQYGVTPEQAAAATGQNVGMFQPAYQQNMAAGDAFGYPGKVYGKMPTDHTGILINGDPNSELPIEQVLAFFKNNPINNVQDLAKLYNWGNSIGLSNLGIAQARAYADQQLGIDTYSNMGGLGADPNGTKFEALLANTQPGSYIVPNAQGAAGAPTSPPGMMSSMGSSGGGASTAQSVTIGGQSYSADQIKSWLAGKSPDQIKAQAQALGMTPQQVHSALTMGGMNVSLPQVQQYMGTGSGATGGSKPPTWQDSYKLFQAAHQAKFGVDMNRPWTADADAARAKEQVDQGYIQALAEYNKANGTDFKPDKAVLGVNAQPNTFTPTDHSNDGFFGGLAKSLGMTTNQLGGLALIAGGGYLAYSNGLFAGLGGTEATAAVGADSATKAALYGNLGYGTTMTAAEITAFDAALAAGLTPEAAAAAAASAAVPGAAGMTAADKALLYSDVGYTGLEPLTAETIVGSSTVPEVVAGTDPAGKLALATMNGPLTMPELMAATGLTAAQIVAAGGTAATGTAVGSIPGLISGLAPNVANTATTAATAATPPWWQQVAAPAMGLVGSVMNQNAARDAANTQADAQLRAAQIAADAAKFRPVGVKTNFGQSQFGYDANGNLNSAGYTLDPLLQGQIGQLAGASGGLMNQFTNSPLDTAQMKQAAMSAMTLGNQYLRTSPQQQAAKYMADQQGLLAPGRASEMANLHAQMQSQGRGGFAMGGGVNGQGAANPQMQALYNARMQQDAQLAAQSTQGGMDYAKFGTGMVGTGGEMLNSMYGTQSASLNPYLTALGAAQKIEGLGQNAMQLGMDLGGKVTNANAAAGALLGGGMSNAANIVGNQAQQAGSLWGNLLQGGAEALSRYKWGT